MTITPGRLAAPYRVTNGSTFQLKHIHPGATAGVVSKAAMTSNNPAAMSRPAMAISGHRRPVCCRLIGRPYRLAREGTPPQVGIGHQAAEREQHHAERQQQRLEGPAAEQVGRRVRQRALSGSGRNGRADADRRARRVTVADAGTDRDAIVDVHVGLGISIVTDGNTIVTDGSSARPKNGVFAASVTGTYRFEVSNTTSRKTDHTLSVTYPSGTSSTPPSGSLNTLSLSPTSVTAGSAATGTTRRSTRTRRPRPRRTGPTTIAPPR